MTDKKPFIYAEFDEPGSVTYKISFNDVSATQLFLIAGLIQFQANETFAKEQIELQKQQLAKPTEGILKP